MGFLNDKKTGIFVLLRCEFVAKLYQQFFLFLDVIANTCASSNSLSTHLTLTGCEITFKRSIVQLFMLKNRILARV